MLLSVGDKLGPYEILAPIRRRFDCHRPYPVITSDPYKHLEREGTNDDP